MLKFSKANAKIHALSQVETLKPFLANKRKVYSLDILSGWSCPFAQDCLSKVVVTDGKRKVVDGPQTQFRCFSASQEGLFTNVYNSRKANFEKLRDCKGNVGDMAWLIHSSLPKDTGIVRIHVAGDFFSPAYFEAWAIVASQNPSILFYAYTKSIPYWVRLQAEWGGLPSNFVLTASRGGRCDNLIDEHGLRCVEVVLSEAAAGSLPIDHDDSHAARPDMRDENFALLIHGTQPAGSEAAKAVKALKGVGSYSRK